MKKCSELKYIARMKLGSNKKALFGAFLLMVLVFFAFVMVATMVLVANMEKAGVIGSQEEMTAYFNKLLFNENSIKSLLLSFAGSIFLGSLMQTLLVGYINVCYKVANGEVVKASDLFEVYKRNPDKIILIYVAVSVIQFTITLPSNALTLYIDYNSINDMRILALNTFVSLVTLFIQLIVKLLLALSFIAYIEDKERTAIQSMKQSVEIMGRYGFRYLYILLSFIGWVVLSVFTYGIALIFVCPYYYLTVSLFYINAKEKIKMPSEVLIES